MQAWEEKYYAIQEAKEEDLIEKVRIKLQKGKSVEVIADELEEALEVIVEIISKIAEE